MPSKLILLHVEFTARLQMMEAISSCKKKIEPKITEKAQTENKQKKLWKQKNNLASFFQCFKMHACTLHLFVFFGQANTNKCHESMTSLNMPFLLCSPTVLSALFTIIWFDNGWKIPMHKQMFTNLYM